MSFMQDDEYIILMDIAMKTGRMFVLDELKKFFDCGIRTVMWCGPFWDSYLSDDFQTFHPEYIDNYLNKVYKSGMKAIIPLWQKQSTKYTQDYYVRRKEGTVFGMLSPWNPEARRRNNELFVKVRDEYTSDNCIIVNGQAENGERVLLNSAAYYDDCAVKHWQQDHSGRPESLTETGANWLKKFYTDLLLEQQKLVMEGQHHEIWYMLARYKALKLIQNQHGCNWIDDYLATWKTLNPVCINHINFNYFNYGASWYPVIQKEMDDWGVHEWVGAEYCEGLRSGNGLQAVKNGLRGLILGPCHPFTNHETVEPWMLTEIKKTIKAFEARK